MSVDTEAIVRHIAVLRADVDAHTAALHGSGVIGERVRALERAVCGCEGGEVGPRALPWPPLAEEVTKLKARADASARLGGEVHRRTLYVHGGNRMRCAGTQVQRQLSAAVQRAADYERELDARLAPIEEGLDNCLGGMRRLSRSPPGFHRTWAVILHMEHRPPERGVVWGPRQPSGLCSVQGRRAGSIPRDARPFGRHHTCKLVWVQGRGAGR
jgi:hypothetical protein